MIDTQAMRRLVPFSLLLVLMIACKGKQSAPAQQEGSAGSAVRAAVADGGVPGDAGADPAEVAARLDKACVGGDLDACRNLGVMYSEGLGVSPDPDDDTPAPTESSPVDCSCTVAVSTTRSGVLPCAWSISTPFSSK